ncbi:MAG: ABC transporter ATP-binding protein [Anaerolineae bacterium]|nr:ABC transporter ATP-binding protein [Anaerolineae bacterium]
MPESSASVIEAHDLSRSFGPILAVDALNLTVARGEIFGLIGPDGAGKTTTLRLLAAVMNPTSGRASVLGLDTVRHAPRLKQHIGYMAQRFGLYGDLTVTENLRFFADLFGVGRAQRDERIARLLRFARLEEFTRRQAARLSGGMQKKLALACTLIHTPELLLLDEPTTGVDPVSRREFWDILSELHLQGITLLISTPYMDEAERCSRVGLMDAGRLVACDTPRRIQAMIQGDLVAVWPDDLRRAREVLRGLPDLIEVQTYGDQLRILVEDAQAAMPKIRSALERDAILVRDMRRGQIRMEEAFACLLRRQGADADSPSD